MYAVYAVRSRKSLTSSRLSLASVAGLHLEYAQSIQPLKSAPPSNSDPPTRVCAGLAQVEAFLLLDLCSESLAGCVASAPLGRLPEATVLSAFTAVVGAVAAMHAQQPPIAHRYGHSQALGSHPSAYTNYAHRNPNAMWWLLRWVQHPIVLGDFSFHCLSSFTAHQHCCPSPRFSASHGVQPVGPSPRPCRKYCNWGKARSLKPRAVHKRTFKGSRQNNYMHACRDIKAENVLRRMDGAWVLADFGSATRRAGLVEGAEAVMMAEDDIRRCTTPAYRAPEMWDLYSKEPIDYRVDVWVCAPLPSRRLVRRYTPVPESAV